MDRSRPAAADIPHDDTAAGGPAIRDADEIAARVTADEVAADEARARYRAQAMPPLEPDARIAPLLKPDERVVAVRRFAVFDRRQPDPGPDGPAGLGGDLYVTSRRLVLIGRLTLSIDLTEIEEAVLSGERLLLVLSDGQGVTLDIAQPRLLRVELAAARADAGR